MSPFGMVRSSGVALLSGGFEAPAEEGAMELPGTSTTQDDVASERTRARNGRAVFIIIFLLVWGYDQYSVVLSNFSNQPASPAASLYCNWRVLPLGLALESPVM